MLMQFRIFTVPIHESEQALGALNAFLRSRVILKVEQELVRDDYGAFWSFCVRYLDQVASPKGKKVDYRTVLDEASFKRFAELRKIRKALAEEEGLPAFAVFTDEQLAALAVLENPTLETMRQVPGIGEKKAARFGSHFISQLENETQQPPDRTDH